MSIINKDLTSEQCIDLEKEMRALWDAEIEKSGKSPQMYLVINPSASQDAYYFEEFRNFAKENHGLDFPPLIEGMTVTVTDDV